MDTGVGSESAARSVSFGVSKSASGLSFGVEGEHGGDDKLCLDMLMFDGGV